MLSGYLLSVGNVAVGKRRFMLHTEVNIFIQGCVQHIFTGARCSSVVGAFTHGAMGVSDRSFMVDPLSYFSIQPVLHDWCMCYPVCGMIHIK